MRSQHDSSAGLPGQVQRKGSRVDSEGSAGGNPGPGEGFPPIPSGNDDSVLLEVPEALAPYLIIKGAQNHNCESERKEKPGNSGVEVPACGFAGLDTLHVAYSVQWGEQWERNSQALADLKHDAATTDGADSILTIAGVPFEVAPNGARGGVFRHYILRGFEGGGIVFELSACSAPGPDYFNAFVRVGAVPCALRSLRDIEKTIQAVIESLGGKVLAHVISRVDPKCDSTEFGPADLVSAWIGKRMITRAKKGSVYWELQDITGFYAGKETMLRVYDKRRELEESGDDLKRQILEMEWGQIPEVLTRVEFQMRREVLAGFKSSEFTGINTFDDLEKALPELWNYLTSKFFRIAEGEVDRKNPQRSKVAKWWESVNGAWKPGKTHIELEKNWKQRDPSEVQMARQSVGCMLAVVPRGVNDVESFVSYSIESLRKSISKMGIKRFQRALAESSARRATLHSVERPGVVAVMEALSVLRTDNLRKEWERVQQWKQDNPEEAAELRAKATEHWPDADASFDPSMWEDGESCIEGKEVEPSDYVPF